MRHQQIFDPFPLSADHYADDIAAISERTIARYGSDEWSCVALTNLLHGHLGIYSTIGAKMGLHACERMGHNHMEIISLAGNQPPLSCLNDGLQTSTGSTLGHGLFASTPTRNPQPTALFLSPEESFIISLKGEYRRKIQHDIARCILHYGNRTDAYWHEVRKLAIRYWEDMDRQEIFSLEPLPLTLHSISAENSISKP